MREIYIEVLFFFSLFLLKIQELFLDKERKEELRQELIEETTMILHRNFWGKVDPERIEEVKKTSAGIMLNLDSLPMGLYYVSKYIKKEIKEGSLPQ